MTNIRYGKLINNRLEYANNPLWKGKVMIANPTKEQYLEQGYKPVRYIDLEYEEGKYYKEVFNETEDEIVSSWVEILV